jgi:hypothetical protein
MFNATALLKQWNSNNPSEKRELDNFWKSTNLDKLMMEIVKNEPDLSSVEFTDDKNILSTKDLKGILTKVSKANKGDNAGTWMHPILYIKFAMYLSPSFEYHVLKFVSDELLKYRNDAGDAYREMCGTIAKIVDKAFVTSAIQDIAKAINYVVFNEHESEIRNKRADESKIRELFELERDITKLINFGFITSFNQLKDHLRRRWSDKWQPKILTA